MSISPRELTFSSSARCRCGAGLAYPTDGTKISGSWECSAVLLGESEASPAHESYPFAFYNIESDNQPSQGGRTTRRADQGISKIRPRATCKKCGETWTAEWRSPADRDPWRMDPCPTCGTPERHPDGSSNIDGVEVRCESRVFMPGDPATKGTP